MGTHTVSSGGADPGTIPVTLEINGATVSLPVAPWVTLLDLLREQLQLTGTKKGCDHGQCGYCTPGQLCSAKALVAEGVATEAESAGQARFLAGGCLGKRRT